MGTEQGPEYYDRHMKRVLLPLQESPWWEVYRAVLSLLPGPDVAVADLGCGTGRLARLLRDNGYQRYWGVDFSAARVREARRYVPEFEFSVGDLFDDEICRRFADYNVFVLSEVLEHVKDDRELLATLPPGSFVVLTVPNYDSSSHVRWFADADGVADRYAHLLDFSAGRVVEVPNKNSPEKKIFVVSAERRAADAQTASSESHADNNPAGYFPFEFAVDFLEWLRAHDDGVRVITYDDLPWGRDYKHHRSYPKERKRWKKLVRKGRLDPDKAYVLLQHDVDSAPERTMDLLREEAKLGLPSNVMIFNQRVNRRHMRDTGELEYTEYPLDIELMQKLEREQGFVIGYHSNVYEQARFDEDEAMRIFQRDVAELRRRFDIRYFAPHGGARGPEGKSNRDLPIPKSLRRSIRWVANLHSVRLDGAFSDGGINNPKSKPEERDLRDFVRTWRPGRRYRVLLHPQYYHTPCRVSPRMEGTRWYDELLAFYDRPGHGSAWDGVPPPGH